MNSCPSVAPRALFGAALVLLATVSATVSIGAPESGAISAAQSPIDLALYGRILEADTRVVDKLVGVEVDYRAIARDPQWKTLVRQVERARPSRLNRQEKLSFWINAYNILTINLITKHYPLDSIKDIGSFFSPVWDIEVATIEGQPITLGGLEHEILRPMGEPRIHSAIVCASISCPPLARSPFRPDALDEDLSKSMRAWLSNPGKGLRIDRNARRVTISKIFDWFSEDFKAAGGPLATIAKFINSDDARWLNSHREAVSVDYFSYDWSLNDTKD